MKLDKDTLVKHQFWLLLGTYALVWVIAVFWLKVAADEPIKKAEKDYTASKTKLDAASKNPRNPDIFCPPWQEYSKDIDKHKQVIWNEAWNFQKDMYDWPEELRAKNMSIPQTELTQDERERYKNHLYPDEVKALKIFVEGDTKKGYAGLLGPVELKGGFDAVFEPQKFEETPTREECWLAQEDFWVKRELFYVVSNAMASQAYMWPDTIDEEKEPMPKGILYRHRYHNQNWEITLLIKLNAEKLPVVSGDSTIKNIQPSHHAQTLTSAKGAGIVFNVFQGNSTGTGLEVRGEPVPWNHVQKFSAEDYKEPLKGIDWSKTKEQPVGLSQAFDWPTCPIRRIEALAIGKQSCRTFTSPLQPNETLVKLDARPEDPNDPNKNQAAPPLGGGPRGGLGGGPGGGPGGGGPGGGPGGPGIGAGMGGPMGREGRMGGGGRAVPGNPTPNNNIERNRYLQAPKTGEGEEKPSRHLPLALQLIVDQAHTSDVLVALANSRLRFQTTQSEWHRVKDIKQGEMDKNNLGGIQLLRTGYIPPGLERNMMPGGMRRNMMPGGMGRGRMSPDMRGMSRGMMPGQFGSRTPFQRPDIVTPRGMMRRNPLDGPIPPMGESDKNKTASNQGDENLVEMTVYGIATLYRLPDPPKGDSPAGQSGQPAPAPPGGVRP